MMNLEIFYLQTVRILSAGCPNESAGAKSPETFLIFWIATKISNTNNSIFLSLIVKINFTI